MKLSVFILLKQRRPANLEERKEAATIILHQTLLATVKRQKFPQIREEKVMSLKNLLLKWKTKE